MKPNKTRKYEPVTPGVCIVVYDLSGAPVSDDKITKVLDAVHKETADEKLAITYTKI